MKKKILFLLFTFLTFYLNAQDTLRVLQEVTISGIKSERNYPITQSITKCDSVPFLNGQKDPFFAFDKISPSIYSQSDNGAGDGYSYLRMRGLDQTRINFNLNGVPLNEMEDQGIYFSNMPGFYNYISDISIQRGVGTSKFGNTSIGGSVNMESRNMFVKDFRFTTLCFGNNIKSNYSNAMYSSGDNKGFAYQIGATSANNSGFKEHSNNNGGTIFYGLGYQNKKNVVKLIAFNGVSRNQLAYYGVPDSTKSFDNDLDPIGKWNKAQYKTNLNPSTDKDRFNQNFVSLNWVNSSKYLMNNTVYFNNVNGEYNSAGTVYGVSSYQTGLLSNVLIENSKSIKNIGFNVNLYKRNHFGSDFEGLYFDIDTINPKTFGLYENTGYKNEIIGYFKYTRKIKSFNILCDLQLRNVSFNVNSDNISPKYNWTFVNPKFGVKKTDGDNESYFTIGYTRREPTRTDILQNIIQTDSIFGSNPDNINNIKFTSTLKSENIINIELGDNYNTKLFDINANLYFMTIENEFVSTGVIDAYSGFMVKTPVSRTFRFGFESDGKTKFRTFNAFYNFQYQKSKLNDGVIPFNPEVIASGGISVRNNRFDVGLFGQYVGKMLMNYNDTLTFNSKEYFTLNGYIKYKIVNKVTLSFSVSNILNSKYYIPAGVGYNDPNYNYFNIPVYYVGQLRSFKLSLSYKL